MRQDDTPYLISLKRQDSSVMRMKMLTVSMMRQSLLVRRTSCLIFRCHRCWFISRRARYDCATACLFL